MTVFFHPVMPICIYSYFWCLLTFNCLQAIVNIKSSVSNSSLELFSLFIADIRLIVIFICSNYRQNRYSMKKWKGRELKSLKECFQMTSNVWLLSSLHIQCLTWLLNVAVCAYLSSIYIYKYIHICVYRRQPCLLVCLNYIV